MNSDYELSYERCFDKDDTEGDRKITLDDFNVLITATVFSLIICCWLVLGELIFANDSINSIVKLFSRHLRRWIKRKIRRMCKPMFKKMNRLNIRKL